MRDEPMPGGEAHALVGDMRTRAFRFLEGVDEQIAHHEKTLSFLLQEKAEMTNFLEQNQVQLREEQRDGALPADQPYRPTDLRARTYDGR